MAQEASFQTYTDNDNGFTINYPTNWSLEKSYGMLTVSPTDAATLYRIISGPYSVSIKEGIMVFPPGQTNDTLQEFAKSFLSSLLNSTYISNVSINEFNIGKSFLSGHPAIRAVYSAKVGQTQTEAKFLEEKSIIDNNKYSISFSADVNKYDSLVPTAESVINSFQLIGGK